MPGPIDDTLKNLTELSPQDWVVKGGWAPAHAALVDADIATISGASDKVIRVTGNPDWLLAVDFQAGHDSVAKLADLLLYNSALYRRHGLSVRSLMVLLHPGSDSPQLTGLYERGFPGEPFDVALRYRILRVWQIPAADWLAGGLGLVPLAPLGDVPEGDLPNIVSRISRRLSREAPRRLAGELWSATFILMGLRYEQAMIQRLLHGVLAMKESVTYQAIIREGLAEGETKGRIAEARKILLLLGRDRFGDPPAGVQAKLDAVDDVDRLEQLTVQVQHVASWKELLRRRRGRGSSAGLD
jgi:hypothetical protein